MKSTHQLTRLLVLAAGIILSLGGRPALASAQMPGYQIFDLSLPIFRLRPSEQVTELNCTVMDGAIVRVNVPFQWNMAVDSSIGGQATLTAFAIDGADAFHQADLAPFHRAFLSVAKDPPNFNPLPFDVTVVLTIENAGNTTRKLAFNRQHLILTPSASGQYPFW